MPRPLRLVTCSSYLVSPSSSAHLKWGLPLQLTADVKEKNTSSASGGAGLSVAQTPPGAQHLIPVPK